MRTIRNAVFFAAVIVVAPFARVFAQAEAQGQTIAIKRGDMVSQIVYGLTLNAQNWRRENVRVFRIDAAGKRSEVRKTREYRDIQPGDKLFVPAALVRSALIKSADTSIEKFAQRLGGSAKFVALLQRINGIAADSNIKGLSVYVPFASAAGMNFSRAQQQIAQEKNSSAVPGKAPGQQASATAAAVAEEQEGSSILPSQIKRDPLGWFSEQLMNSTFATVAAIALATVALALAIVFMDQFVDAFAVIVGFLSPGGSSALDRRLSRRRKPRAQTGSRKAQQGALPLAGARQPFARKMEAFADSMRPPSPPTTYARGADGTFGYNNTVACEPRPAQLSLEMGQAAVQPDQPRKGAPADDDDTAVTAPRLALVPKHGSGTKRVIAMPGDPVDADTPTKEFVRPLGVPSAPPASAAGL